MSQLSSFKLVPQLDRSPAIVSFAQRPFGKIALVASFSLFLFLLGRVELPVITCALLLFSFFPQHRRVVLTGATLSFLLFNFTDFYWGQVTRILTDANIPYTLASTRQGLWMVALVMVFCAACVHLAGKSSYALKIRRPVMLLSLFYIAIMCAASYLPMPATIRAFLWIFIIILGRYFWYLCYSLRDCKSPRPPTFLGQMGNYLPFWQPGNLPYPKGWAYLDKIESKTQVDFAVCQLKGLKLIYWAWLLSLLDILARVLLYGDANAFDGRIQIKRHLGEARLFFDGEFRFDLLPLPFDFTLPHYTDAFERCVAGSPYPLALNWATLIANFMFEILYLAVAGHIIIAIIRMCGFNALRNTWRPLSAPSIAEFWNRFYYYFKELLVEFFFYPVFVRHFKKHPKLRMYAATLAAAGFGNFLFHFFKDIHYIIELGFFQAIAAFQTYIFYCFLLGTGIFLSQQHQVKHKHKPKSRITKALAPAWVLSFYCLLNIFGDFRREGIMENFTFLFALFGIDIG
jgi:hypothetical protein